MAFQEAIYAGSFYDVMKLPMNLYPQIAFVGRSNVGKSSLLNCLVNKKNLAQVSKTPGKTKAINLYEIDRRYYFVDLPGYGYARVSKEEQQKWRELIESYLSLGLNLKGIIHLIDSRRGLLDSDIDLIRYMTNARWKIIWVLTKADKLGTQEKARVLKDTSIKLSCPADDIMLFSATRRQGIDELRKSILKVLKK